MLIITYSSLGQLLARPGQREVFAYGTQTSSGACLQNDSTKVGGSPPWVIAMNGPDPPVHS